MEQKNETNTEAREVRLIDEAYQDLDDIFKFIAIDKLQPLNARKVQEEIWDTINKIRKTPFAFKEYERTPTEGKLYRQARCLSWLIIYKITSSEIVVLQILHASKNYAK
jgi:toxin ParE1/3/4